MKENTGVDKVIVITGGTSGLGKEAARALVHLAVSEELANTSGKYFQKFKIGKSSKQSLNVELQKELWKKSLQMIQETISDFKATI